MKIKDGVIEPGMVIHTAEKEQSKVLLKHLKDLGYVWDEWQWEHGDKYEGWDYYGKDTCFGIGESSKKIIWAKRDAFRNMGCIITEFTDLLEEEDSIEEEEREKMSAEELLIWLEENYQKSDVMKEVFGKDYFIETLMREYPASDIVEKICAWQKKKAQNPVEVEWMDVCRVFKLTGEGQMERECVYEEYIPAQEEVIDFNRAEQILKEYVSEHEGRYIVVIEGLCRVKEGE